jgi:hypothetical protein
MANFGALTLTRAGRKVLAQAQTELPLHFSRVSVGDGELPDWMQAEDLAGLVRHVQDLPINGNAIIGDGTTRIEAILHNSGLAVGFDFREIGLFAIDNDTGGEILYAYSNAGDLPDYIPAGNGPNAVSLRIGLLTVIKQAQNVVVNIDENWGFVTQEQFDSVLLNFYGPCTQPDFLWTADSEAPKKLRPMPFKQLFELLFKAAAPDNESVLLGYDPITQTLFGYPLGGIIAATDHLRGGDPGMQAGDYPDGRVSGGGPDMGAEGYPDGRLSGGSPLTY